MIAAPANSEPDFYGAMIRSAKIGPRRELTLCIETWPKGRRNLAAKSPALGFGAIGNFAETQKPNLAADGLQYLKELSTSTIRRRVVEMQFDPTGKRVSMVANKIALIDRDS